jgi:hypothetical protein
MPDAFAPAYSMCMPERTDAVIAVLAGRQHGVVSRAQLLAAGVTERQIHWRLRRKRLHRVYRGVYAVGHAVLSQKGRWMAAVLAAGAGAALSHWSAATLLRMRNGRGPRSHVSSPKRRRAIDGVTFHYATLADDEVTVEDGIPVTTPARTAVDLAPSLPGPSLARMLDAVETRGAALAELVERYPRRAGVPKLRGLTAVAWTRSDLEGWFLEAIERAGLPQPAVNANVGGHEVDFAWREHGVIAELDTYLTHGSRYAFEHDRERDRKLTAAGWRVVRLTEADRDGALRDLSRLLGASAARSPSRRAAA